jgi:tetratricopeptide (TPR) repeat protein
MGSVYLAELLESRPYGAAGTQVAVKLLHTDLVFDPQIARRFQREAELGTSVVHDAVVRTHEADVAEVGDQRYFYLVMEYVEGRTLAHLLDGLGALPEALLRDLAAQIAAGLGAIHEAGAIHRDLKPANILLTPDHQVKVMDLGVAHVRSDDARVTTVGDFVGTLHYASPEQFEGVEIGPASDLYSLGVVLYEAATGRQPFAAAEFAQVMRRHLDFVPEKAGRLNPQVSPFLEEVIAVLLEKAPERRFPSAQRLHHAIEEAESSGWWIERETTLRSQNPRGELRRMKVPAPTSLVGRSAELGKLREHYDEARAGMGRLVLIEGEAGVGKSRLVDEFLGTLERDREDALVLHGAHGPGGQAARGAFAQSLVEHFGESRLEQALERHAAVTARLVPAFVAWLTGAAPPEGADPLSPDAIHAVFCHVARSLARERPLIWIIEDLHFAAPDAIDLLTSIGRIVHDQPILLVTAMRPGMDSETLSNLQRLDPARRLVLPRLDEEHVVEILREASGSQTVARDLGLRIVSKSDGNPFFVFEMLRDLEDRDLLTRDAQGRLKPLAGMSQVEAPSSVRELLHARLNGLDETDRHLLDVAAIQGFNFDADLVARVLGQARLGVLQSLAAMERRHGVVRASGSHFRFDHHLLQEVVFDEIPLALRQEYHALLAGAFEDREQLAGMSPEDMPGDAAVLLARHYLAGGRAASAEPMLLRAVEHLAEQYHADALLDLSNDALRELGPGRPGLRCDLRLKQVECLDLIGRRGAQRAAVEDATEAAEESGDLRRLGQARAWLGWLLLWLSRYDAAERVLESALSDARAAGDRGTEARAISNLGLVCYHRGKLEEARDHHERDLALSLGRGHRRGEARANINLGLVALRLGEHDLARERLDEALQAFSEIGYRQGEALALMHLGLLERALGRHDRARERLVHAIRLCREIGYRHGQAHALVMLGPLVALEEGRLVEAQQHVEACLEIARALNARSLEAEALLGAGQVARARGDAAEADRLLEESLQIAREVGAREVLARTACALGRRQGEAGRQEEALGLLAEAQEIGRELGIEDLTLVAAAETALLGARSPEGLEPPGSLPIAARAEVHERLHRAGAGDHHRVEARRLLEEMSAHLDADERETFWLGNPTAQRTRAD